MRGMAGPGAARVASEIVTVSIRSLASSAP